MSVTSPPPWVEIAGIRLVPPPDVDAAVLAAMQSGRYEEPEMRALAATLRADDVVMELGTGIGLLSAWCARRIGSDRVFTFEANPELEAQIRQTYRLNGVSPQLQMCMLTEHAGEQEFFIHEAFWASSSEPGVGTARAVRVPTLPLNEQIRRIDPSVLVMDIKGGEHALMAFIDLHRITRVVAEIHERQLGRDRVDAIMRRFYEAGFRIDRELSAWEVCCLERHPQGPAARVLTLDEFTEGPWRLGTHWCVPHLDTLATLLPPGCRYAMVDGDQWSSLQLLPRRTRTPFVERDGQFWGAPEDDAQALQELERQRSLGLQFLVFGGTEMWWLDHYTALAQRLHGQYRLIARHESLVAFAL